MTWSPPQPGSHESETPYRHTTEPIVVGTSAAEQYSRARFWSRDNQTAITDAEADRLIRALKEIP